MIHMGILQQFKFFLASSDCYCLLITFVNSRTERGAQWLSGRVIDLRPRGCGFEPHRRQCVVSLSKNNNPSLVLIQPRKTLSFITERLLMGRKESKQTKRTERMGIPSLI